MTAKNYSHILTIALAEGLSESDFHRASESIKQVLDGQPIIQDLGEGFAPCIVWRYSHQSPNMDLVYVTDVQGILGDKAVMLHTKSMIKDMGLCRGQVVISKPLTKKIAMV